MKKIIFSIVMILSLVSSISARDDVGSYSIESAMQTSKNQGVLTRGVKFYFGSQKHPKLTKNYVEIRTSKKTSAFGKTDAESCEWAFLSALKTFEKRAVREGGDAVINIKSNYKNNVTVSNDRFQCGAGAFVSGVALIGEVVKLK